MSVFSFIRRGRQAAKKHNAKQAAKQKEEEEEKPPYQHIPRHAAIDALSGGPATWRETDRSKVVEQNRRRSILTANGVGMGALMTPTIHSEIPRASSSLFHVSYPSGHASPVVQTPRSYGYASTPPAAIGHAGEALYTHAKPSGGRSKGKEVERVMANGEVQVKSGCVSRVSSQESSGLPKQESPPIGSTGDSTSSQDELEAKPIAHRTPLAPVPAGFTTADGLAVHVGSHRLHSGLSRRVSDPSPPNRPRGFYYGYYQTRPAGPHTAILCSTDISLPLLPPVNFDALLSQSNASPPLSSNPLGATMTTAPATAPSGPDSYFSIPLPSPSSPSSPTRSAFPRMPLPDEVAGPIPPGDDDETERHYPPRNSVPPGASGSSWRRTPRTAMFAELETISSHGSVPALSPTPVPSLLPPRDNGHEPADASPRRQAKFTKGSGSKLLKKSKRPSVG